MIIRYYSWWVVFYSYGFGGVGGGGGEDKAINEWRSLSKRKNEDT